MDRRFSIIVPCQDVSEHIDLCVYTLVKQKVDLNEVEILLVDNASSDDTYDKLCAWEQRYPGSVILIRMDEPASLPKLCQVAYEYASGEYISLMGANDWLNLNMYGVFHFLTEQYHPDIIQFACGIREKLDEDYTSEPGTDAIEMYPITEENRDDICSALINPINHRCIYKKELIDEGMITEYDLPAGSGIEWMDGQIMRDVIMGGATSIITFGDEVYYQRKIKRGCE